MARNLVRFFTGDKVVKSPAMNRMGAQVARTVLARVIHNVRAPRPDPSISDYVATLRKEGSVSIPNFLPPDVFEDVVQRTQAIWDREQSHVFDIHHGPNTLHVLAEKNVPITKDLSPFFDDPRLKGILSTVENRPNAYGTAHKAIECLVQGADLETEDPETKLHSDIFYSTHKAWLYLTDVKVASAPLVYVNGSREVSRKMLGYVYRESCGANAGSRRITQEELDDLGLKETVFTCPRNTLVIADTFGHHRRLRGEPGEKRLALHVSLRGSPFFWWR